MSKDTQNHLLSWIEWGVRAIILAMFSILISMYDKLNNNAHEITALKARVTVIESQMVGWDVLTRIERTLGLLAASGKGNESMAAVAGVLKTERESRHRSGQE